MDITEHDRLELRHRLRDTIGDRSTEVLMEALPPMDYSDLASKADLEQQRLLSAADLATMRAEMSTEFAAVRTEMSTEFAAVRTELHQLIGSLALENARQMRLIITANVGTMLAFTGLVLGMG